MKTVFLNTTSHLIRFFRLTVLLFAFLLLINFASHYVDNPKQYTTLMKVNHVVDQLSQPIIQQIKLAIPYKYHQVDYSTLILIVMLLILAHLCSSLRNHFLVKIDKMHVKEKYYEWRDKISKTASQEQLVSLDTQFEKLATSQKLDNDPDDRKKLLSDFVLLKSKLDGMGQQLAFLSIDIVDSAGMKKHEDKHLVSYDFDRYNDISQECLKANGVVKYATTPDGIMSCFRTVDDAVQAATDLLDRLKKFNSNERKIKREFKIRAGINTGFIYIDKNTPLEQISDRAIDIAGHMQKYAKPDTINIAASAIEPLKNRGGFFETADVIDEQRVYQWHFHEDKKDELK